MSILPIDDAKPIEPRSRAQEGPRVVACGVMRSSAPAGGYRVGFPLVLDDQARAEPEWRRRLAAFGVHGLSDEPRPDRPRFVFIHDETVTPYALVGPTTSDQPRSRNSQ